MEGIIELLYKHDCIKSGVFTLKSGKTSRYYYNLKNIISYPNLTKKIGTQIEYLISSKLGFDKFNLICGIPFGGIPVSQYLSLKRSIPAIHPRFNKKTYGTSSSIEGVYKPNDKVILIEDVMTSGGSIKESIDFLSKHKLKCVAVFTIIDRMESGLNEICGVPIFHLINKTDLVKFNLNKIIKEKNSRLCFSADITDKEVLLNKLNKVGPSIAICKLHCDIIEDFDDTFKKKIIHVANNHNFMLMEDRKFSDISMIVGKQWNRFRSWIDLVTVHANVNIDVIDQLYGVLLVADMSNNKYNHWEFVKNLVCKKSNNIVGFITQKSKKDIESDYDIDLNKYFCMTPGIKFNPGKDKDQIFRNPSEIDTDIFIVGRGIYNSENVEETAKKYRLCIKL